MKTWAMVLVLSAGCAASGARPAEHAANGPETIGPAIDLSAPVALERIETLAAERQGVSGERAREVRWEVVGTWAHYAAGHVFRDDVAIAAGLVAHLDDAVRARVSQGTAAATDAERAGLCDDQWHELSVQTPRNVDGDRMALDEALRRPLDASIGPPPHVGAWELVATPDELVRIAMTGRSASERAGVTAALQARREILGSYQQSWRHTDAEKEASAASIAHQSAAYLAGRASFTDVEAALTSYMVLVNYRAFLLERLIRVIGMIEWTVGRPLELRGLG